MMNTEALNKEKNKATVRLNIINKLLDDTVALKKAIEDLAYLQKHAGEMIFTGNSGKCGERSTWLKTIKVNTLDGCVVIPKLLIELAEKRIKELEVEASNLLAE